MEIERQSLRDRAVETEEKDQKKCRRREINFTVFTDEYSEAKR